MVRFRSYKISNFLGCVGFVQVGVWGPGVEQDPDRAETGRDRSPGNHYSLTNSYSSPESTCVKEEPNSAPVRPAHTVHDFT